MPRPCLLLGVCLVLAGAVPPAGAAPAAEPDAAAIDAAIERGVDWLLEQREPSGLWGTGDRARGHTALAGFTLLHCGLREEGTSARDRALARALARLEAVWPGLRRGRLRTTGTYETSLLLLLLRDRGPRPDRDAMQRLVEVLERSQAANGQWSYEAASGRRRHAAGDNSNTQFAVLALGAAVGEGLRVDPEVLRRAWRWWRTAAQPDGGFGYSSGGAGASASTGSMTAAGISSLAILEAALGGEDRLPGEEGAPASALREAAEARLGREFAVDRNFGPTRGSARQRQRHAGRGWLHYYLWSVERAMVLAGRERLAGQDWYGRGAAHLLATQREDGSWRGEHPLYATCFALLFLARAADPPRVFTPRDEPLGPVTDPDAPEPDEPRPPTSPPSPPLRALLEAEPSPNPAAVLDRARADGPSSLAVLVRALDDPAPAVRQAAHEALLALLGEERVGRADRHPLARGRLALWVRRHHRHLVLREGRFVPR